MMTKNVASWNNLALKEAKEYTELVTGSLASKGELEDLQVCKLSTTNNFSFNWY